jgi:hypothetical protein
VGPILTVGKHLCNFPGEIYSTSSEVASVAGYRYRVTLEVLLRFFVRQHVDPFVASATQIDGTAFDTITRTIFWFFLCLCRVYGTRWCVVISPTSRRHNSHDGILLTLLYADDGRTFFALRHCSRRALRASGFGAVPKVHLLHRHCAALRSLANPCNSALKPVRKSRGKKLKAPTGYGTFRVSIWNFARMFAKGQDGQRFLHDGRKVHDGGHGGSLLTVLKALGRQRGVLHYTPSSLLCKTSVNIHSAPRCQQSSRIAASLKFFQLEGYFPSSVNDIPYPLA